MPIRKTESEKSLQETKDLLLSIISNAPYGVSAIDLDGKFTVVNFQFINILRKDARVRDLIGRDARTMFQDLPELVSTLDECLKIGGKPFDLPLLQMQKGGETISLSAHGRLIREGMLVVIEDISELVAIEETSKRQMIEFVAVASHQLRTPLTAISLFVERLLREKVGKIKTAQREHLEIIYQSTRRMILLVNELLSVARLEAGTLLVEPTAEQVEDLIQETIDEMKPLARQRKCTLVLRSPKTKLPKIAVDRTLLHQVVNNLITNAVRYSPSKRCNVIVTINAPALRTSPNKKGGKARVSNMQEQDYLRISIADKGFGIPEEAKSRIFEKFFRADNARKAETEGTGLGLYIAKLATEAWGGKIWFDSHKGQGSTFFITIPMTKKKTKKETRPREEGLPHVK